ncbi:MAG: hypothetical protein MZV65_44810 [Chromatiales bacterium]|nr:hypothetical protein [Chromatiales bacterium]
MLTASPYGVLIRSIKENEQRVAFLGYNTRRYKWVTFVHRRDAIAALSGGLFTLVQGFVSPRVISPFGNVDVIFAVLIGGAGTLYGALIGGTVLHAHQEFSPGADPGARQAVEPEAAAMGDVAGDRAARHRVLRHAGALLERCGRSGCNAAGPGVRNMIQTVIYGFTIGAILYFFSIGLSLTFGTMHIINFAHGMVYTLGVYLFITLMEPLGNSFLLSLIVSLVAMLPVGYLVERFVIRRLYGESLDYAIIATYGVLLIGTDVIKLVWGTTPYPVSDPVGLSDAAGRDWTCRSISILDRGVRGGAVPGAAAVLQRLDHRAASSLPRRQEDNADERAVPGPGRRPVLPASCSCMGSSAWPFSGGILYAPISTAEPYMGFHILLLAFAVVIVGGMGNLNGTFVGRHGARHGDGRRRPVLVPGVRRRWSLSSWRSVIIFRNRWRPIEAGLSAAPRAPG